MVLGYLWISRMNKHCKASKLANKTRDRNKRNTMTRIACLVSSLIFFGFPSSLFAERDSNANIYGNFSNPNVAYSHYWEDAHNVYQDLSSFRKLYVKFHNCAWSATSYSNNNNGINCGSSQAQSEDYWWMGMQPCIGANVAFSLYGILSSDQTSFSSKNQCSKATFINSFFTTDGLGSFTKGISSISDLSNLTEVCTLNGDGYGIATGCSSDGTFMLNKFNGSCNEKNYVYTINTLDSLNQALVEDISCHLIYSSDGSVDYATNLLAQSSACLINVENMQQDACPDPYGMLKRYEYNLLAGQMQTQNEYSKSQLSGKWTFACFIFLMSMGVSLVLVRLRQMRKLHQEKKRLRYVTYIEEDESIYSDGSVAIAI